MSLRRNLRDGGFIVSAVPEGVEEEKVVCWLASTWSPSDGG